MLDSVWSTGSNRKIDPTRRQHLPVKPDGSPDDNDRVEIGPTRLAFDEWAAQGLDIPNLERMRQFRLERLTAELRKRDIPGLLLFDPLNIRYATDTTNMQVWITHNPARACFVAADGDIILWDFHHCEHLSAHLPLITEVRNLGSFFYFEAAERSGEKAMTFAKEVDELIRQYGGDNRRIAVDKIEIDGLNALRACGLDVIPGQEVTEMARVIKGEDDLKAMRCSIFACEAAMHEMEAALVPGMTEDDLWAHLHAGNIRRGGEWIETRLLASGPRTNPWFQECGPRIIQDGDIVAFDTDLIGCYGICCDMSRTWIAGDGPATDDQRHLYQMAYEHIMRNMEILKPGMTFRELSEAGHQLPEPYIQQRYGVKYHGVGLCDEYPSIRYIVDWDGAYDGVLEPGMALCVEAYVGAPGEREGVKLEDQVIITDTGYEKLTQYPYDARMMA